jgi:type IV pilus assembly protein PilE
MNELAQSKRSTPAAGRRQAGFTLVEAMITVVILGILAAMVYPSYRDYVVRTQRDLAKSAMLQVLDRQEQFFIDNKIYANTVTALGFAANPFAIDNTGKTVTSTASNRVYTISLADATATGFTIQAVPQLRQATEDSKCGTLSVTNAGVKSASGTGSRCW